MRQYGIIESKFWPWANRHQLTDQGKLLAVYLLTGPHSNSVGVYYLPPGYVSADLHWPFRTVTQTLAELFRNGFARVCESTDFAFLPDYIPHNLPANPNVGKKMAGELAAIPRQFSYWSELQRVLKPFGKRFPDGLLNRLPMVAVTMAKPEPNLTEPNPPSGSPRSADADDEYAQAFQVLWDKVWMPYKMSKGRKKVARERWETNVVKPRRDIPHVLGQANLYCVQCQVTNVSTAHVSTWLTAHGFDDEYDRVPDEVSRQAARMTEAWDSLIGGDDGVLTELSDGPGSASEGQEVDP